MRYFLILALSVLVFASCNKAEAPVTREDELRSGRWKISGLTINHDPYIGQKAVYRVYDSAFANCDRDNYIEFSSNYLATQKNGEKCSGAEPDEVPFRWELEDNGEKINFWFADHTFFGQPAVSAPFLSYTENSFSIRFVELETVHQNNQDTFTYTYTFQKF